MFRKTNWIPSYINYMTWIYTTFISMTINFISFRSFIDSYVRIETGRVRHEVRVGEQFDGYTNGVTSNRYPGWLRIFRKPHLDMTAPRFHLSSCSVCSARVRTRTDLLRRNRQHESVSEDIMQLKRSSTWECPNIYPFYNFIFSTASTSLSILK